MDQNEILNKIREICRDDETFADRCTELRSLFEELDEWLSQGGFPPQEWDWNPLWKT